MEAMFNTPCGPCLEQRTEVIPNAYRKHLATIMVREVARVLGIKTPNVRFFYRSPYDSLNGYAYDGVVHVAADLNDLDLCRAILHECRHVWQRQSPEWRYRSESMKERDAKLFELSWPR
jgi:hypothetical protein